MSGFSRVQQESLDAPQTGPTRSTCKKRGCQLWDSRQERQRSRSRQRGGRDEARGGRHDRHEEFLEGYTGPFVASATGRILLLPSSLQITSQVRGIVANSQKPGGTVTETEIATAAWPPFNPEVFVTHSIFERRDI